MKHETNFEIRMAFQEPTRGAMHLGRVGRVSPVRPTRLDHVISNYLPRAGQRRAERHEWGRVSIQIWMSSTYFTILSSSYRNLLIADCYRLP
jgi:hypothetical protein